MFSQKFYLILALMVVFGLGIFYAIQAGFYPVALVNSELISGRTLNEAVASAEHFLSKTVEDYSFQAAKAERQILGELRRATLDKMIENILIHDELQKRSGSDLNAVVGKKIDNAKTKSPDFEKGVLALYGIELQRFEELVLIPQAREEILFDKIKEENQKFEDWIRNKRKEASVVIIASDLKWDGGKVVLK